MEGLGLATKATLQLETDIPFIAIEVRNTNRKK